jgi:hypothetical protein
MTFRLPPVLRRQIRTPFNLIHKKTRFQVSRAYPRRFAAWDLDRLWTRDLSLSEPASGTAFVLAGYLTTLIQRSEAAKAPNRYKNGTSVCGIDDRCLARGLHAY